MVKSWQNTDAAASCGENRGVNTTNPRPWLPITEISIEHVDGPHIWKLLTQAKQTNVRSITLACFLGFPCATKPFLSRDLANARTAVAFTAVHAERADAADGDGPLRLRHQHHLLHRLQHRQAMSV